jgi:hypothetical protein
MATEQDQMAALDQELKTLRADYHRSIRILISLQERAREEQVAAFNAFHAAGLAYFNAHEHAIPLDARLNMDLNPTCYTDRSETSANVLEVIGNHYETLWMWAADLKMDISTMRPSRTAFANMQRRVKETQPEYSSELRERFIALDLPTRGFDAAEVKSARVDHAALSKSQTITYTGCAIGDSARVEAGSINSTHNGDVHVGDKINIGGNVTGSAVGSNASLKARDIVTQIQQSGVLDADLKRTVVAAAEALANLNIDEGDKSDAADDLAKLKSELEKPTKDEGRIQKIWNRINDMAPTVASILASAVTIGKIVGVVP